MAKIERKSFASSRKVNESLLDDFFTTEEERNGVKDETAKLIPISKIDPFPNHPFRVEYDSSMAELVDSIRERGLLSPILVRKVNDRYQLISGHRRKMACELNGLTEIPATVVDMSDDEATIAMVETNFHRQRLLPSEKAYSYKMRYDAMKHQGKRSDLETSEQVEQKSSADALSEKSEDNAMTIRRYIRLTFLNDELLKLVDENRIAFIPAVTLSYLPKEDQGVLLKVLKTLNKYPSLKQADALKELSVSSDRGLSESEVFAVMTGATKNPTKLSLSYKALRKVIPSHVSSDSYEAYIMEALEFYKKNN